LRDRGKEKEAATAPWARPTEAAAGIFVYRFAKSARSNIDPDEAAALKKLATTLMKLTPAALTRAQTAGEIIAVNGHA